MSEPHGLLFAPEIERDSMPKELLFAGAGAGAAAGMVCCRGGEKSLGGGAGLLSKKLPPLRELFCAVWPVGDARFEKDDAVGMGGDCMPPKKSMFDAGF